MFKETWGDRVNFAGLVANGRVFRGEGGRYVTFVTLGVANGEYVDVTIKKPFGYRDTDVVVGSGKIRMSLMVVVTLTAMMQKVIG